MEEEYWAHHYYENPDKDEVEDDDFNLDDVVKRMEDNPDDWETII